MIRTPVGLIVRALLAGLLFTGAVGALGTMLPADAGAYATVAPPPIYSTAPGLPDGRVYEQVSPTDKNGNEAGAGTNQYLGAKEHYAFAAPDGNSVLFEGTGAMGETTSAYSVYFVAQRSSAGWTTRSLPRPQQSDAESLPLEGLKPHYLDPSSDLSHVMSQANDWTFAPQSNTCYHQIYLGRTEPTSPETWLEQPEIANPIENCAGEGEAGAPVGGTPDFSTVYFTFPGTLLPEDASRAPHAQPKGSNEGYDVEAWGFYEDREGALREAGVLPDGSLDPFGAVPAASGHDRTTVGNQVSADGSRAFFVSPDPASCGNQNNCAVDPPELYVRENGEKTLLVSEDTLLPSLGGLPASAPTGVFQMVNPTLDNVIANGKNEGSYVFASPDGSQAFFQSEDKLTGDAPEGPPGNVSPKTYDFDVESGSLTYLPNVVGEIVATSTNGSTIAFVNSSASPAELDLWSAGSGGGTVTPITQLPEGNLPEGYLPEGLGVTLVRMSSDGSVVVFETAARIAGFNNGGTHYTTKGNGNGSPLGNQEIYRYDAPANELDCVSCPPAGVAPTGDAEMSPLRAEEDEDATFELSGFAGMVDERGISSDGSRIFFDTPDPLVPQDVNTGSIGVRGKNANGTEIVQEGRDVYEWENGVVYLISSGKSSQNSFFLDNSESGSDVFFATAESLVPGDTDGAYDVYDARIPHPGDNPPPTAVPCQGSVCQGPPRVPSPLGAPASATFSGLGNVPPVESAPAVKQKSKVKKKTKAKKTKPRKHAKKSNRRGK